MTAAQLRKAAREALDALPADKVKVAAEFLRYLNERASDEATEELLRIPGFEEDMERAEQDIAAGRLTDWREVRRDV